MGTALWLHHRGLRALAAVEFLPGLLARVVVGYGFANAGWAKLGNLEQVIGYFEQLGIPLAAVQAPFVSGVELLCGGLLVLGLATRLSAGMLLATMVVAIATAILPGLDRLTDLVDKTETLYVVILLTLLVRGGGAASLDAWLGRVFGWSRATAVGEVRAAMVGEPRRGVA